MDNRTTQENKDLKRPIDEKEVLEQLEREGEVEASPAEKQVRETEDASLQDETYSFDEQNTDNEEYHDVSDADEIDLDNDDDFVH